MRKEDLKDWTRDRLKDEIVNLSEKNFNLEWRIKQFEESEGRWKCENESLKKDCKSLSDRTLKAEQENSKLEDMLKTSSELINVLEEKLSKYEGVTIIVSGNEDGYECEHCGKCNDELKAENKDLKQKIRYIETMIEASHRPESVESVMRKTGLFSEEKIPEIVKEAKKRIKEISSNYEQQLAPDDDIPAFNHECIKQWGEEPDCKKKILELQDQHKQDCIRINDLRTAYLITVDELAKLRELFGVGR